jgi:integrase
MAKKRGKNEGSLYQRQDGSWCAQVTVGGKRLTKYAKTKRECRDWLKETLAQIESGINFQGAKASLSEYLEQWLLTIKPALRPKTVYQYKQVVRMHIVPILGEITLKDLRPDHIQNLYNRKSEEGLSPRMVRLLHAVLHRALNQAMFMGLITRNPTQATIKPKIPRKEMETLTDNQVQTFLLTARGARFEMIYLLALTTGLRAGELLGLRWSDLDWVTCRLQVKRQLQRLPEGKGLAFSEPKSSAGRRVVVLGTYTLEKLREHYNKQQLARQFAGERWQEDDLIFTSTIGTPLDLRNVYREYKEILKQGGLPDLRFHDLRHTAATLMLQQGIHPKVVQERLGHSQISLTLDTYSHVLPSMQEDAAQKLDDLVMPVAFTLDKEKKPAE